MLMFIDYFKLLVSVVVCLLVGFISGISNNTSMNSWYKHLKKPSFNPPGWIFAPVWTLLYILMGISFYLVWAAKGPIIAIIFFFVQLALNFIWSFLFFSMKNPLVAFIDIVILLVMILLTVIQFYPVSRIAALLFIPYILWVCFATMLNFTIYWLNR